MIKVILYLCYSILYLISSLKNCNSITIKWPFVKIPTHTWCTPDAHLVNSYPHTHNVCHHKGPYARKGEEEFEGINRYDDGL